MTRRGISAFVSIASMYLNTATLWNNILDGILNIVNTSIISTGKRMITDSKTWLSYLPHLTTPITIHIYMLQENVLPVNLLSSIQEKKQSFAQPLVETKVVRELHRNDVILVENCSCVILGKDLTTVIIENTPNNSVR